MDILNDLRTIDTLAWRCVYRALGGYLLRPVEAFEEARDGIVERIAEAYAAGEECTLHDLSAAGWRSVNRASNRVRGRGNEIEVTDWESGQDWYGRSQSAVIPSPEQQVVDRMALREVMTSLPERQQEVLGSFAACGNIEGVAAHLQLSVSRATILVREARQAFFRSWFDWETPPKLPKAMHPYPLASHCGRGHEFTPENTRYHRGVRSKARTTRYCLTCSQMHDARRAERRRAAKLRQTSEGNQ